MTSPTGDHRREPAPTEREVLRRWAPGCSFVVVLCVAAVVLMNLRPWSMPLSPDDARTLAEVGQRVALGSSLEEARRTMERSGFECAVERAVPIGAGKTMDRLYCTETRLINRWRIPFFSYTWRVWFILDGDTVTSIGMNSGLDAI